MNKKRYEDFLRVNGITEKAINSRITKGLKAEEILGMDFDTIVNDDDKMYEALKKLRDYENPNHAPLSNSLRRYYEAINEKEFPRLNAYTKKN